jgi:opacity protein-like surface antigen
MQLAYAFVAAMTAVVLAGPVSAQDAAQPADVPMAGVSGYDHPEIGPDQCQTIDPGRTQCVIPAKSAGRYLVVAEGTSTANTDGATQTLQIGGNGWTCGAPAQLKTPWSSGKRTFARSCVITVLSDNPVPVVVVYSDTNASKDPKGPTLMLRRMPWDGVLSAETLGYGAKPDK